MKEQSNQPANAVTIIPSVHPSIQLLCAIYVVLRCYVRQPTPAVSQIERTNVGLINQLSQTVVPSSYTASQQTTLVEPMYKRALMLILILFFFVRFSFFFLLLLFSSSLFLFLESEQNENSLK